MGLALLNNHSLMVHWAMEDESYIFFPPVWNQSPSLTWTCVCGQTMWWVYHSRNTKPNRTKPKTKQASKVTNYCMLIHKDFVFFFNFKVGKNTRIYMHSCTLACSVDRVTCMGNTPWSLSSTWNSPEALSLSPESSSRRETTPPDSLGNRAGWLSGDGC